MTTAKVAWFTGLSGAGKSTIAQLTKEILIGHRYRVLVLDGDVVRQTLHKHLGFTPADIRENNRLLADLCFKNLPDYDFILVPIISPFRESREAAKGVLGGALIEVYVYASLDEVQRRDPKGLYRHAQQGLLSGVVGIAEDVPFEAPESADLILDTETLDAASCSGQLADFLLGRKS